MVILSKYGNTKITESHVESLIVYKNVYRCEKYDEYYKVYMAGHDTFDILLF